MSGHLLREMTIAVEQTFDIIASDFFFKHRKASNYFSCQVHSGAGIFVVPQGLQTIVWSLGEVLLPI